MSGVDTSAETIRGGVALLRASMTPLLHSERMKMADMIEALAAERDALRQDVDALRPLSLRCDRLAAEVEKMRGTLDEGAEALAERDAARAEAARLEALLNTPELHDFAKATVLEAAHQRERWGQSHDAGKTPEDWFWLLGYLGQKVLRAQNAGDTDKALHHTISTAAALANWHAAIAGTSTTMRPGIGPGSAVYPAARAALAEKEPGA